MVNFSENLRVIAIALKLLELTQFLSPNLSIYTLILYGVGVRCDRGRFLIHNPFIEKSIHIRIYKFNDNNNNSDITFAIAII